MPGEQIWPDRRTEQWCSSGRKILTSAQGLRSFSESSTGKPMLSFQYHASSEMRGCLRLDVAPAVGTGLDGDVLGLFRQQKIFDTTGGAAEGAFDPHVVPGGGTKRANAIACSAGIGPVDDHAGDGRTAAGGADAVGGAVQLGQVQGGGEAGPWGPGRGGGR